jgi:iron(III) transport system substrate-binding protein
MRRLLIPVLLLVTLVTPFALRTALSVHSAGRAGGAAASLRIITSHAPGIRQAYADAFRAYYRRTYGQDVDVDYTVYGTSDVVRTLADADTLFPQTHTLGYDLAWGGGDFVFNVQLKGHDNSGHGDLLQGVTLDPALLAAAFPKPDLNGQQLYDVHTSPPEWFGTALSSFGITYNRDVLRYLGLPDPTTWADLRDGRYMNWIITADPTRSTSTKQAYMAIVERAMLDARNAGSTEDAGWAKGMGLVRQICANCRSVTDASSTVPGIIASGDAAVGMTIDYYGRSEVEAVGGSRLGYVQPAAATVTNPDPIGMVKGAPHPKVAKRFIEFCLSREGQVLWNRKPGVPGGPAGQQGLRRLPIMPSVYGDPNFTDPDNPFTSSGGFNKSDAREKTFNILGQLIEASCLDPLDELRATRKAILASPRAKELDAKLGLFPFDQQEALARLKEWNDATPVGQLKLMREWTADFRKEYAKLRQEAER